ncbi:unnamed protein product, partial [Mesorhabditis spiculigera]
MLPKCLVFVFVISAALVPFVISEDENRICNGFKKIVETSESPEMIRVVKVMQQVACDAEGLTILKYKLLIKCWASPDRQLGRFWPIKSGTCNDVGAAFKKRIERAARKCGDGAEDVPFVAKLTHVVLLDGKEPAPKVFENCVDYLIEMLEEMSEGLNN